MTAGFCLNKEISEAARKKALEELRETPENVANGLKELRQIVIDDGKLNYDLSDEMLMIFLRPCKFYPKSAFELVSNLFNFCFNYFVVKW